MKEIFEFWTTVQKNPINPLIINPFTISICAGMFCLGIWGSIVSGKKTNWEDVYSLEYE